MVCLFGIAGLAGAGKTTAAQYLSEATRGQYIYIGDAVLAEVKARGLAETRENERLVRVEVRQQLGFAAWATRYTGRVSECLANGISVAVDAIFVQTEFDVLKSCAPDGSAHLLAIEASFDVRQARLMMRSDRPF